MTLKVAFATDNGKNFIERHFGDAKYYDVYEISDTNTKFIKRIKNTIEEDVQDLHADPEKAKGIAGLFKDEYIQVLVSKVFGPNIQRIKLKFVCVLINDNTIEESIINIQKRLKIIQNEWQRGEMREYLNFKNVI